MAGPSGERFPKRTHALSWGGPLLPPPPPPESLPQPIQATIRTAATATTDRFMCCLPGCSPSGPMDGHCDLEVERAQTWWCSLSTGQRFHRPAVCTGGHSTRPHARVPVNGARGSTSDRDRVGRAQDPANEVPNEVPDTSRARGAANEVPDTSRADTSLPNEVRCPNEVPQRGARHLARPADPPPREQEEIGRQRRARKARATASGSAACRTPLWTAAPRHPPSASSWSGVIPPSAKQGRGDAT